MLLWYKRLSRGRKTKQTHDEMFQQNEAQLLRERVSLEYDLIRSLAR